MAPPTYGWSRFDSSAWWSQMRAWSSSPSPSRSLRSSCEEFITVCLAGVAANCSPYEIKTLGNGMSFILSPFDRPLIISKCTTEERQEKLSRLRNKKTKRNFDRNIKYACRKALADNQPRIRGRFVRTEESDVKRQ
ncbi:zinc finger protein CONSTANS-LIKE 8-like [Alnus glutinosa]|uniref:zinc finger protein CONSTANS-LIKE 8-like n=1 Tax=Alnus glutinosa TaxID=3517 RepID=UPI002D76D3C3|nr:zinc finger protein CONSTANS-LIKE 8-like [Alnus glutinosa]